jgi:hypothetical protein
VDNFLSVHPLRVNYGPSFYVSTMLFFLLSLYVPTIDLIGQLCVTLVFFSSLNPHSPFLVLFSRSPCPSHAPPPTPTPTNRLLVRLEICSARPAGSAGLLLGGNRSVNTPRVHFQKRKKWILQSHVMLGIKPRALSLVASRRNWRVLEGGAKMLSAPGSIQTGFGSFYTNHVVLRRFN